MKPFSECRLYTFLDTAYLEGRDPGIVARELCAGGSDVIQLRAKHSTPDQVRALLDQVLPLTAAAGVGLVVNDHPQIAIGAGAFACHLGQEDFFDSGRSHAREVTGSPAAIQLGLSTHSPDQALRALRAEPDYVAIGPIHPTPTKASARPVTLDYVRWAAAHVTIPWFAIGGITLENVDAVLAAGASRICVVSAILRAPDIAGACQEFRRHLLSGSSMSA